LFFLPLPLSDEGTLPSSWKRTKSASFPPRLTPTFLFPLTKDCKGFIYFFFSFLGRLLGGRWCDPSLPPLLFFPHLYFFFFPVFPYWLKSTTYLPLPTFFPFYGALKVDFSPPPFRRQPSFLFSFLRKVKVFFFPPFLRFFFPESSSLFRGEDPNE